MENELIPSNGELYFKLGIIIAIIIVFCYFYFRIVSPTEFSITPITTTPIPITTTPIPMTTTPIPILPDIPSNYVLMADGTYTQTKIFKSNNTTFGIDVSGDLYMRYNSNLVWISTSKEAATFYTIKNGVITLGNDTNSNLWSTAVFGVSLVPSATYTMYLIDAAMIGIVDTSTNKLFATYWDGLANVAVPGNSMGVGTVQVGYCQYAMQSDGNFVIYVTSQGSTNPNAFAGSIPIWDSKTSWTGAGMSLSLKDGVFGVVNSSGWVANQLVPTITTANANTLVLCFNKIGQIITKDSNGIINVLIDASSEYYSTLNSFTN